MERTTNLSLKKPGLDDDALISDLNDNFQTLDSKIGPVGNVSLQTQITNETTARSQADSSLSNNIAKLQQGIAIIVEGDTASVAVPVGGYAYIKNNMHGLADGLYKNTASSTFPVSGGTADSTVFTNVPTGAVNDAFSVLNSKITNNIDTLFDGEIADTDTQYSFITGINLSDYKLVMFTAGEGTGQPVFQGSAIIPKNIALLSSTYVYCFTFDGFDKRYEIHGITNTTFIAKRTTTGTIKHRLIIMGIK